RTWTHSSEGHGDKLPSLTPDYDHKRKLVEGSSSDIMGEVTKTHQAIQSLDKTIATLEMELVARRLRETKTNSDMQSRSSNHTLQKVFVVIGINTAFSSKKRRDSVRQTWMPRGAKLKKLEKEKGIVIRFVIGHSATPGGALDKAIDAEEAENKDFLRLNHVCLHKAKPRVYVGCMKSGPVLFQKGLKYHEPEFWKFGEEGNKYFRHATGQIYAISKDLAAYISINQHILHRYANEDVSLGSWFIGLEVEHVDDRSMCCGTPPDCEWKMQDGNVCVASFDWSCSGICNSIERIKEVHDMCGEGDEAIWKLAI
ncbi:Glycosyl transferase, family 31, partial [Dillenia turbinata]